MLPPVASFAEFRSCSQIQTKSRMMNPPRLEALTLSSGISL
jgi:hypothetical protein